jgi:hypothetical protein
MTLGHFSQSVVCSYLVGEVNLNALDTDVLRSGCHNEQLVKVILNRRTYVAWESCLHSVGRQLRKLCRRGLGEAVKWSEIFNQRLFVDNGLEAKVDTVATGLSVNRDSLGVPTCVQNTKVSPEKHQDIL